MQAVRKSPKFGQWNRYTSGVFLREMSKEGKKKHAVVSKKQPAFTVSFKALILIHVS
jgi:hypothetical protein